jgi:hypothetical protein
VTAAVERRRRIRIGTMVLGTGKIPADASSRSRPVANRLVRRWEYSRGQGSLAGVIPTRAATRDRYPGEAVSSVRDCHAETRLTETVWLFTGRPLTDFRAPITDPAFGVTPLRSDALSVIGHTAGGQRPSSEPRSPRWRRGSAWQP